MCILSDTLKSGHNSGCDVPISLSFAEKSSKVTPLFLASSVPGHSLLPELVPLFVTVLSEPTIIGIPLNNLWFWLFSGINSPMTLHPHLFQHISSSTSYGDFKLCPAMTIIIYFVTFLTSIFLSYFTLVYVIHFLFFCFTCILFFVLGRPYKPIGLFHCLLASVNQIYFKMGHTCFCVYLFKTS